MFVVGSELNSVAPVPKGMGEGASAIRDMRSA